MTIIKKYKPFHDAWLSEHLEDGTYKELAERFEAEFGIHTSETALRHRADRIGLDKKLNRSHAVKGQLMNPDKELPVGSERITDGIVWVKVNSMRSVYNKKVSGGYTNGGNWRKKAYINWEKKYGAIPSKKRLVYLDGDSTNCDADNLCFTDVGVQMHVARQGYQNGNKDITLAAIRWYELHNALKTLE